MENLNPDQLTQSEHNFFIKGDSRSILYEFIESVTASVPVAEEPTVRELLLDAFTLLFGPDFALLAEGARSGCDIQSLLRDGLYQVIGALLEERGEDIDDFAEQSTSRQSIPYDECASHATLH